MDAPIANVTRKGAILTDGTILTDEKVFTKSSSNENESFLNKIDHTFYTSQDKKLCIYESLTNPPLCHNLGATPLSINQYENTLALLLSNNTLVLMDKPSGNILFLSKQKFVVAHTNEIAEALFFNDLVIFPTLDGKIVIVNHQTKEEQKSFIVSNEKHFNNVTFLEKREATIFAGNRHNLRAITPKANYKYEETFNAIRLIDDQIITVSNSGNIAILDKQLTIMTEVKLPFAGILNISEFNNHFYFIERSGFLIQTDRELSNQKIYALSDSIEQPIYITDNTFYYQSRSLSFPK